MTINMEAFAKKFSESRLPHLGQPTSPPLGYKLRSETEAVVILADGRKFVVDPTQPVVKEQPPTRPAPAVTQDQVVKLMAQNAELLARLEALEQSGKASAGKKKADETPPK